jgi:hypothetical protein
VGAAMTGKFSQKASRPTVVRLLDSRGHASRYLVRQLSAWRDHWRGLVCLTELWDDRKFMKDV